MRIFSQEYVYLQNAVTILNILLVVMSSIS